MKNNNTSQSVDAPNEDPSYANPDPAPPIKLP